MASVSRPTGPSSTPVARPLNPREELPEETRAELSKVVQQPFHDNKGRKFRKKMGALRGGLLRN